LVFLAELGDKTQLAVIAQTCRYRCPWPVFMGASLALAAVTALGVIAGRLVGALIPQRTVEIAAGLGFVLMGVITWLSARKEEEAVPECETESDPSHPASRWNWQAFATTLGLLFLAELGDKTQLAVLGLSTQAPSAWAVLTGGALALAAVSGLGVIGGQYLSERIPRRQLERFSALAFVVIGILTTAGLL
jgi:putative Ca2+/H+ antiporter (TMEM165/GDT1 family)